MRGSGERFGSGAGDCASFGDRRVHPSHVEGLHLADQVVEGGQCAGRE
ncbi:hypothetical protein GFS60_07289 (plasmid) [Rhodococcus sp. WAY2]|nr:hypothetical protein GFS60_07289 [Rhodococcus sp. WAY2]